MRDSQRRPMRIRRAVRAVRASLTVAVITGSAVVIAAALIAAALVRGFQPEVLLYNPAFQHDYWPFNGLLLHIGVFAIGSAGVICLFAALHAGRDRALLLAAGAFSLVLATDDFFMLHQHFWPRRGIPPEAVYAVYALICIAIAVRFRVVLLGWRHAAFWVAVALLAGSLAIDLVADDSRTRVMVIEDTLKFAGFLLWSYYWIARANRALRAGRAGRLPGVRRGGDRPAGR